MQLGVFAEELAALAVGKVVFGSHGCLVALVLSLFLAGGFTGGNQPQLGGVLAGLLEGMDHDEERAVLSLSEGDPALLGLAMLPIIDRNGQRVAEHGRGALETDAVLAAVGGGLGSPDIHHGGQMPGGALHEVLPQSHHGDRVLHPNPNQGVTDVMQ